MDTAVQVEDLALMIEDIGCFRLLVVMLGRPLLPQMAKVVDLVHDFQEFCCPSVAEYEGKLLL